MSFVFYGKVGEMSSNDPEDQELSIVCLHLLQACMGYVNTALSKLSPKLVAVV